MTISKFLLYIIVIINFYYPALFTNGAFSFVVTINFLGVIYFALRIRRIDYDVMKICIIVIFFYTTSISFHQNIDSDYIKLIIVMISVLMISHYLTLYFRTMNKSIDLYKEYLKVFYNIILINGIISILQISNLPGISEFFINLNQLIQRNVISYNRPSGLMGGFDLNGIFLSIGIFLGILLYRDEKNKFLSIIKLGLLLIPLLFSARTGIISLFIMLILASFIKNNFIVFIKNNVKGILIFSLVLAFLLIGTSLFFSKWNEILYSYTFEGITEYVTTGRLETASTQELFQDHYSLPTSKKHLILGDGINNKNREIGRNSDVAYVQLVYSFGILMCIFIMLFIILTLFKILQWKHSFHKAINLALILNLIIISFKGPYLFNSILLFIILSFYYIGKYDKDNNLRKNKFVRF